MPVLGDVTGLPDEGQLTDAEFEALGRRISARAGGACGSAASAEAGKGEAKTAATPMPVDPVLPPAEFDADEAPIGGVRIQSAVTIDGVRRDWFDLYEPTFEIVEAVLKGRRSRSAMISEMARMPDGFLSRLRFSDADRVTMVAMALAPKWNGD